MKSPFFMLAVVVACFLQACTAAPKTENASKSAEMTTPTAATAARPTEPEWAKSANLYELNVRQFSPEGNFAGVEKQLPRLKAMGVDVIWLMPIFPISVKNRKGSLGSPYSVQDYQKVNPNYGTLIDFQRLVEKIHASGMKIILDWVPNHTGWDHVWQTERPEVYTRLNGQLTVPLNERGEPIPDWSDVCDLNFAKAATHRSMIDALAFWVKNGDVDGFRFDMAGLVPDEFWAELRPALDPMKPLFFLSEWEDAPSHFTVFNANYGWKWKDATKEIAAGKRSARALDSLLTDLKAKFPPHFYQIYFTQNHDENSWNGTTTELYGPAADCFTALACVWQGMPLVYNGQEDGLSQRLHFFDRDPIRWKNYGKTAFFQTLFELKHRNRALDAGLAGGPLVKISTGRDEAVYAFQREKNGDRVVCIFNLSNESQDARLDMTGLEGAYTDVFGHSAMQIMKGLDLKLKAWEFLILTNK